MTRRGQLSDIATYIVLGFVFSLVFLVGWLFLSTWNTEVQGNDLIPSGAKTEMQSTFGDFGSNFDKMFLLIYIGTLIGTLVLSYVLRTEPGLFFVLLIIVFILSMIAGYLGNAFVTVTEASDLVGVAASFTITTFVMNNYLLLTIINAFLMLVVFFAKPGGAGL